MALPGTWTFVPYAIMNAFEMIRLFSRTLKYVASTVRKGYSSSRGRVRNSDTDLSRSLQTSDTADLENDVPQSVSMTLETLRVDTPLTTISAMLVISAASLRE